MKIYFTVLYFFVYSFLGWCTEVSFAAFKEHRFVNRGFLNGPFCPIYGFGVSMVIVFLTPYKSNLILLYLASVFLVTLLEGLTGWAMDKIFHNKWWDYSDMPMNIGGYVCLLFSLIWGAACVAIMNMIHPMIHRALTFLPQAAGIFIIVVLGITLSADMCVTASAIFKFNRRMASMEKITAELREISDQIGEDIYEGTVRAMEAADQIREKKQETAAQIREKRQEAAKELHSRSQEIAEDILARIGELKGRYQELSYKRNRTFERLMMAYPTMRPRRNREHLEVVRERLNEKLHSRRKYKK